MQEGEAYGTGSDVAETLLRAEEKTRTVPVRGREWEASIEALQPRRGRGMDAAER